MDPIKITSDSFTIFTDAQAVKVLLCIDGLHGSLSAVEPDSERYLSLGIFTGSGIKVRAQQDKMSSYRMFVES
jgi:hypothetical protein